MSPSSLFPSFLPFFLTNFIPYFSPPISSLFPHFLTCSLPLTFTDLITHLFPLFPCCCISFLCFLQPNLTHHFNYITHIMHSGHTGPPPHFTAPPSVGPGGAAGTPGQGPQPFPFRAPPGAAPLPLPLPLPQHLQQQHLQQQPPPLAHMQGQGPGPYRSIAPSLFSPLPAPSDPNSRPPPIQGQGQPSSSSTGSTVIAGAATSYGQPPPYNTPGSGPVSYSAPPSSFSSHPLPHPHPVPQHTPAVAVASAVGDVTLVWADEEYSMVRFILILLFIPFTLIHFVSSLFIYLFLL